MVYVWKLLKETPSPLIGEYPNENCFDRFGFKSGEPIDLGGSSPFFRFNTNRKKLAKHHDLPNNAMVPLVSTEIADVLTRVCPDDVQLIPVTVFTSDGTLHDRVVLVATKTIDILDRDASEFTCMTNTDLVMSYQKLVYRSGVLGKSNLARDADFHSHLLVGEKLAEQLLAVGKLGIYNYADL